MRHPHAPTRSGAQAPVGGADSLQFDWGGWACLELTRPFGRQSSRAAGLRGSHRSYAPRGPVIRILRTETQAGRPYQGGSGVAAFASAPSSPADRAACRVGMLRGSAPEQSAGLKSKIACYGTNFTAASQSCCGEMKSKMLATEQSVPATAGARVSFDLSPAGAVSKNITPMSRR